MRKYVYLVVVSFIALGTLHAQTYSIGSNEGIMWGVNGHPVQGGPYTSISYAQQMSDLVSAGLKNYRMDLYNTSQASTLSKVITAASAAGIQVLPILIPSPLSYSSEAAAYAASYTMGKTYAAEFATSVQVWELGNEYDGLITISGDGSNISQYNQAQFALVLGTIQGLLDGIHAGNPNSKGIVDTEGVCHYGFTDGLWADGVHWDITGEHWYSLAGNITDMVGFCTAGPLNKIALLQSHYGKPIWITEFGYNSNPSNKTAMASWLTTTMTQWNEIAQTYDLESAQIYELFDQSSQSGIEAHFGIMSGKGSANAAYTAAEKFLKTDPSVVY